MIGDMVFFLMIFWKVFDNILNIVLFLYIYIKINKLIFKFMEIVFDGLKWFYFINYIMYNDFCDLLFVKKNILRMILMRKWK